MCDTFVALPAATADGSVVFGKNSDREPNEAQHLITVAPTEPERGSALRCTHISIPHCGPTHGALLAKPYWIWGAEMGVNDQGVVIGNEALFNKGARESEPGLIGMDLLRLGLERGGSAAEAVGVITELLGRYGQSGQAGHTHDFEYDNSFIVADAGEAIVVETIGREWVARRVRDVASISNGLTTRSQWDMASVGVTEGLDVARRFAEPIYTRFADAAGRQCSTEDALSARQGSVTVLDAMAILRSHSGDGPDWSPATSLVGQDVCMHAGFGPVRSSQTTGSLIAQLCDDGVTVWVTGTAAPCTSVFKPVWVDAGLPDLGTSPRGYFNAGSLWWQHELLHRAVLLDYPHRRSMIEAERDATETALVADVPSTTDSRSRRRAYTQAAFDQVTRLELQWWARIRDEPIVRSRLESVRTAPYRHAWQRFDSAARFSGDWPIRAEGPADQG